MLIEWLPVVIIMTPIALIIIWDHKTTKREEKRRKARETEESES